MDFTLALGSGVYASLMCSDRVEVLLSDFNAFAVADTERDVVDVEVSGLDAGRGGSGGGAVGGGRGRFLF